MWAIPTGYLVSWGFFSYISKDIFPEGLPFSFKVLLNFYFYFPAYTKCIIHEPSHEKTCFAKLKSFFIC